MDYRIRKKSLLERMKPYRMLYLMLIPSLVLVGIFSYGPMYGMQIAFKDYNIGLGIWGSEWVGLKHFRSFIGNRNATTALRNTFIISFLNLGWGFPMPIVLAVLLNEISNKYFKRISQTISYLPYFISWIVVSGFITNLLAPSTGVINSIIMSLGGKPILFLTSSKYFRSILVISNIWKNIGYGSIVYLAALSGIDPTFYEAAIVDGASRIQRVIHITLPNLIPVAAIMLILNLGGIMNAGFDQIFNLANAQVYDVADILDTYIYRVGLAEQMLYSFSSAVGFFKSVVGFVLVISVNLVVSKFNEGRTGMLF